METRGYNGVEVGPIRPPSEAQSLLLRITRNCPWNKCKFCGLYDQTTFSIRPKEHVIQDIDTIKRWIELFKAADQADADQQRHVMNQLKKEVDEDESWAYTSAINWYQNGMKSVFLQDSNSLVIKPDDLVEIIRHLKRQFPEILKIL